MVDMPWNQIKPNYRQTNNKSKIGIPCVGVRES